MTASHDLRIGRSFWLASSWCSRKALDKKSRAVVDCRSTFLRYVSFCRDDALWERTPVERINSRREFSSCSGRSGDLERSDRLYATGSVTTQPTTLEPPSSSNESFNSSTAKCDQGLVAAFCGSHRGDSLPWSINPCPKFGWLEQIPSHGGLMGAVLSGASRVEEDCSACRRGFGRDSDMCSILGSWTDRSSHNALLIQHFHGVLLSKEKRQRCS